MGDQIAELTERRESKSERERAMDLRDRVRSKLDELLPIMDEASRAGMRVEFQLGVDGFGRNMIGKLDIVKSLV